MSSQNWVQSPTLSRHLEWLLDQIEPRREQVQELVGRGHRTDFFCFSYGATNEPPSLPRSVHSRAAALGSVIEIDHYTQ